MREVRPSFLVQLATTVLVCVDMGWDFRCPSAVAILSLQFEEFPSSWEFVLCQTLKGTIIHHRKRQKTNPNKYITGQKGKYVIRNPEPSKKFRDWSVSHGCSAYYGRDSLEPFCTYCLRVMLGKIRLASALFLHFKSPQILEHFLLMDSLVEDIDTIPPLTVN